MTLKNMIPVRSIALMAILAVAACDNPVEHHDESIHGAEGVEITDIAGAVIATYADGGWTFTTGDALHLHPGEESEVRIYFIADDGDRFQAPLSGDEYTLLVEFENPEIAGYEGHADHGDFVGLMVGETSANVQLYHGTHPDFETIPGLPVEVVDHEH
jgi:hypothetical protein